MRVRRPGKIRDGLWYLGRRESGIYLLEGQESSLLISGGMSYLVPEVLHQMRAFGIEERRIGKVLILHSHFDHIGVVPFFKRRAPEIEVLASQRAWEILSMEKAIATINEFSREVATRMGMDSLLSEYDLEWRKDITGSPLQEGDRIDLGGLEVIVFETPGHSSCCLAAYVPAFKALFPTDGGGIPFGETIVVSGNSNFTRYQESLERLRELPVEIYGADHYGYVLGEEARTFIPQTIEMAKRKRAEMEEAYRATRDIDAAARRLIASFYEEHPDYFLSPEIYFDVHRQMIRHIAAALEGKGSAP
ncbi:MAG: MBL fold metallo-hydrolase [Desulfobacterota bacterium]|nr:MBL fold metallo-hydrolase [Thermodesulfobacteriota bacterium]